MFAESLLSSASFERLAFGDLDGFRNDNFKESWTAFLRTCNAIVSATPHQRVGIPYSEEQKKISKAALDAGPDIDNESIRHFFEDHFTPFLVLPHEKTEKNLAAFFTAYYRPEVAASPVKTDRFSEPLLARPSDLVTLEPGQDEHDLSGFAAARRLDDGRLVPYPTRSEIDSGVLEGFTKPVAFVADAIEAFMIHVQGSARLRFPDGQKIDLTYAGRNGRPYTSIGKILIADGEIPLEDMSLDRLKTWVRENGQVTGQKGRALLHRNESFVFFSAAPVSEESAEPLAAANVRLTSMRSLAVDRSLWPYGLPFWIEADLPWQDGTMNQFRQLMFAQDTGSAILGPARADLYFGTGDRAGALAGNIRHFGRMIVLMPKSFAP